MKILVISDIIRWKGFEEIFDNVKPDVVVLPGDLTSDGFAAVWNEAVDQIAAYQKELKKLNIFVSIDNGMKLYRWIKKPKKYKDMSVFDVVDGIRENVRFSCSFP